MEQLIEETWNKCVQNEEEIEILKVSTVWIIFHKIFLEKWNTFIDKALTRKSISKVYGNWLFKHYSNVFSHNVFPENDKHCFKKTCPFMFSEAYSIHWTSKGSPFCNGLNLFDHANINNNVYPSLNFFVIILKYQLYSNTF